MCVWDGGLNAKTPSRDPAAKVYIVRDSCTTQSSLLTYMVQDAYTYSVCAECTQFVTHITILNAYTQFINYMTI